MPAEATRRYTLADVYDMPDDGQRYELLDGVLYVTPLARVRHQLVVARITYRLMQWTDVHGGMVFPGVNVDLSDDTHLEPDVAYTNGSDRRGLALAGAPELIVEVSSQSTKSFDRGAKKDRYASEGAEELWLVDLDEDSISQFLLQTEQARSPRIHQRGDQFTSGLFDGLVLDVDDLLGPAEE